MRTEKVLCPFLARMQAPFEIRWAVMIETDTSLRRA